LIEFGAGLVPTAARRCGEPRPLAARVEGKSCQTYGILGAQRCRTVSNVQMASSIWRSGAAWSFSEHWRQKPGRKQRPEAGRALRGVGPITGCASVKREGERPRVGDDDRASTITLAGPPLRPHQRGEQKDCSFVSEADLHVAYESRRSGLKMGQQADVSVTGWLDRKQR
jgi:hypothetical protein